MQLKQRGKLYEQLKTHLAKADGGSKAMLAGTGKSAATSEV
ncbi:hypothetical protein [Vibrio sp. SCSIO 43137]|nr:hypothetical protein [Vibrio sp. SCSIO 43137]WCE32347.1 hypothetical protein PK654_17790 [Vibrio sp. SCSIO 43137]